MKRPCTNFYGLLWGCALVCLSLVFAYAESVWTPDRVSRYEFTEMLEQAQCHDCLVPSQEMKETYTTWWLEQQKKDPQKAIDDISFQQASREDANYYYCVARVVDKGIMNGFPKMTSPFCPGKFCGSSFLTVSELIESLVRLVGATMRKKYEINRIDVARRAKDTPSVTVAQRKHIAQALKRCPQQACPAEHAEEFALWLRRCSLDLARCNFVPIGAFTKQLAQTPKVNVLLQAGVLTKDMQLWTPYDLVPRAMVQQLIQQTKPLFACDPWWWFDRDHDGVDNRQDFCPYQYDPKQHDLDGDGLGDVCDDDIDGDGIKNERGVVDAWGWLSPKLVALSTDNCILLPNTKQDNEEKDLLWNACDPERSGSISKFSALQVDATPYRGVAPLRVDFTQKNKGLVWLLQRDFGDGITSYSQAPTHVFVKEGIYMVKARPSSWDQGLISMVPIEVLPDSRLQAWLELLTKNLLANQWDTIVVNHVAVGDIKKLTLRGGWVDKTINPKDPVEVLIQDPWTQKIELQAYNSVGQRVALSQVTLDTTKRIWSQLHVTSLDPEAWKTVDLTTVFAWFDESEVLHVQRDFGDAVGQETWWLTATHTRQTPGVYLVKQTLQFRDRSRNNHENVVTVFVRGEHAWRKMHLRVDALEKWLSEPFVFTLETENFPVQEIRYCTWSFTPSDQKKIVSPALEDLEQPYIFWSPGSYPVMVLCQSTTNQWYHTAVTVAVDSKALCLTKNNTLRCDLDKDGIPDLCDEDIDGDTISNRMNLLTKEFPDCRIDAGNIHQQLFSSYTQACAQGAPLDNCPFIKNKSQEDAEMNGRGDVCDSTWQSWMTWWWAWTWGGGWWWGGEGNWDADGDGIPDSVDACWSTPESANGQSDKDGCPEAPNDETSNEDIPNNPLVEVDSCTQCPCPEADYASALRKWDRVRAMLLDEAWSIIYRYTKPEIIQEDIPSKFLGQ